MKLQFDRYPVVAHHTVAEATWRLVVEAPAIARSALPGQFVMLGPLGEPQTDPFLNRPFSLSAAWPEKGLIEILYAMVGRGTQWLTQVEVGRPIGLLGPRGNPFRTPEAGEDYWLVAGGLGVAPLCFLAQRAAESGAPVTFLYGARNRAAHVPLETLENLGVKPERASDDGSLGFAGRVGDLLEHRLQAKAPQKAQVRMASCGPVPMLRQVAGLARRLRFPLEVSLETHMACGVGACLGCTIDLPHGRVRVCAEGPVFAAEEVFA